MTKRTIFNNSATSNYSGVWLVSLVPAQIKVVGGASGILYVFEGSGSRVYVDERDVDGLLAKHRDPCECSSVGSQPYFERL